MKRLLSLALVVMLVLSLFTACGGDSAGTNPGGEAAPAAPSGEKDSVIVAMNADPTGFDPQVTLDATAMMVMYNIYDTLVESDGACSSDIRPGLAESWDISDDNMVYTFHLKSGVKFHNGEPFTAADAKFTIERAMVEPATASYCASIDKVDAPDDSTLVVTLKVPFANFLMNLGGSFFGGCALAVLLGDRVERDGQTAQVALQRAAQHRKQCFPVRELAEFRDLRGVDHAAVNKAGLDNKLSLAVLRILGQDLGRDDLIAVAQGQGGGSFKHRIQCVVTDLLCREAEQRVLDDRVLDAGFPQFLTELGIVGDIDPLVVDQHARGSIFQLFRQRGDRLLFLLEK